MRVESVGRIQPHVRAKVIDEHGSIVPVGKRVILDPGNLPPVLAALI